MIRHSWALALRANPERQSAAPRQPPHHLVKLLEVAVADLHRAAGIAVVDADGKPERVADPLLERDRVGILGLGGCRAARLAAIIDQLGTAALDMRKQAALASAIAQRTLLSIAVNAKRRG